MPTTGAPGNIWYPDATSPVAPLENLFLQQATSVNDALNGVTPTWTSYTPTWGATGTDPVLGNGTIIGRYAQVNKIVTYQIHLTAGSTTTFGSGLYSLSLPVAFAGELENTCLGTVVLRTNSSYHSGSAMAGSATIIFMLLNTTLMTGTAPGNFVAGRALSINGTYEVA